MLAGLELTHATLRALGQRRSVLQVCAMPSSSRTRAKTHDHSSYEQRNTEQNQGPERTAAEPQPPTLVTVEELTKCPCKIGGVPGKSQLSIYSEPPSTLSWEA